MGGSRGADFMITRTRGNPWQINFDFTTERNLLPCHPERSKNYAKRSSHGVEGPLAPERKDGREKRHFDNGTMGRTPCRAGADVKLHGVLRLRWIIRKANDPPSLRMTTFFAERRTSVLLRRESKCIGSSLRSE